jgi:hypothetical protein
MTKDEEYQRVTKDSAEHQRKYISNTAVQPKTTGKSGVFRTVSVRRVMLDDFGDIIRVIPEHAPNSAEQQWEVTESVFDVNRLPEAPF